MDWWNLHIQSPGRRDGHLLGTPWAVTMVQGAQELRFILTLLD
jgi:hypothetical protein